MRHIRTYFTAIIALFYVQAFAQQHQDIFNSLLPTPQSITIANEAEKLNVSDIVGFHLAKNAQLPFNQSYFPNKLYATSGKGIITLAIDKKIKNREGYQIILHNLEITVKASTQAGILYGVQTLKQLSQNATELNTPLPAFDLTDSPQSEFRAIHIDLKHHLDKKAYMYSVLDKMAYYKLNAAIVEFEDKIKYESYPVVGASNALSIQEWREWADYANKLNIEVSPLIQGIGHADFILKHDEMKHLRESPASDWVCCPSNEEYYKVQFGLYADAIKATPHGKYVHVGGDEVGDLNICDQCKKRGLSTLELQLDWLRKVSKYIVSQKRIPIFWDDMVFKQLNLYEAILDAVEPEKVDSIWKSHLSELDKHIHSFPKEVIYMRWQYGNANQLGTKTALQWYNRNKLQVMGATAAQTTHAMMSLGGFVDYIKSFQIAQKEAPIKGVLCTAWDDASPLFETYWRGFIAHAQYSWNITNPLNSEQYALNYRIREFGNNITALPDFRRELERSFPLWETGLLDEGRRHSLYRSKGKYKLMELPTAKPGEWSDKYQERIDNAQNRILKYYEQKNLLRQYRSKSIRNQYSLQVFERINDLTAYTAKLLIALSDYDVERDETSLKNLKFCLTEFDLVRQNTEQVYGQIRYLNQPEDYQLPMNHHHHLAIQTANSDWMFLYELEMVKKIKQYLNAVETEQK